MWSIAPRSASSTVSSVRAQHVREPGHIAAVPANGWQHPLRGPHSSYASFVGPSTPWKRSALAGISRRIRRGLRGITAVCEAVAVAGLVARLLCMTLTPGDTRFKQLVLTILRVTPESLRDRHRVPGDKRPSHDDGAADHELIGRGIVRSTDHVRYQLGRQREYGRIERPGMRMSSQLISRFACGNNPISRSRRRDRWRSRTLSMP